MPVKAIICVKGLRCPFPCKKSARQRTMDNCKEQEQNGNTHHRPCSSGFRPANAKSSISDSLPRNNICIPDVNSAISTALVFFRSKVSKRTVNSRISTLSGAISPPKPNSCKVCSQAKWELKRAKWTCWAPNENWTGSAMLRTRRTRTPATIVFGNGRLP